MLVRQPQIPRGRPWDRKRGSGMTGRSIMW
jgi:hypothetical protein